MFLGEYFIRHYRGRFYAKAQNLVRPPKAGAAHAFEQTGDRPKWVAFGRSLWRRNRQWRREWDSNPRYAFTHTRFPSVRLKPLGHPSVPGSGK